MNIASSLYMRRRLFPNLRKTKSRCSLITKRIYLNYIIGLIWMVGPHLVSAQIDSLAEIICESMADPGEVNTMIEEFSLDPLDINSASRQELEFFSFLTPAQIDTILESRPFKNKTQFRELVGKDIYLLIRPLITVARKSARFHLQAVYRLQVPLEKSKGYKDKIYQGSSWAIYNRIRFRYLPAFSGGILTQKDSGEPRYFDHYTGYLQWQNPRKYITIILGTYQIQSALGLVFSSPFGNGKGIFPTLSAHPQGIRLSPLLSANEKSALQGSALQFSISPFLNLIAFYSCQTRDALLVDNKIQRLESTGYHRTAQEISRMDLARETVYGTGFSVSLKRSIMLGSQFIYSRFTSASLASASSSTPEPSEGYGKPIPNRIGVGSFFFNTDWSGLKLTGELAANNLHNITQQYALAYSVRDNEIGMRWWWIQNEYLSPFGRSFASSNSFPRAKNGFYLAVSISPLHSLRFSVYWTTEKDLWRTYFNPMPLSQKEFLLQTVYFPDRTIQIQFRYGFSQRYRFDTTKHKTPAENLYKFRVQLEKSFSPYLRIRCRIEKIFSAEYIHLQGINLYNDMNWQAVPGITLTLRFSSFVIEDYLVHTYEYENDLPGAFSSYSVYDKGNKWYLLLSWQPTTLLSFWIKYRILYLPDADQIGSGNDQITGDHKQEFKFQISLGL